MAIVTLGWRLPFRDESECSEYSLYAWKLPGLPPKGWLPVYEFPCGPGIIGEPLLPLVIPELHNQRSCLGLLVSMCSSLARWPMGESWQLFHLSVHSSPPILAWPSSSSG